VIFPLPVLRESYFSGMAMEKDKTSRKGFIQPDPELLSKLLSMDIVKVERVPPRVRQTMLERETDVVLLIQTKEGKKFILHLEFQSNNDPKMVIRMAIYDYILYEEQKLEVLSIVLYIGKEPLNMENEINFFGNHYSCKILDIRDLDSQWFIESNNPRLLIYSFLAGRDEEDKKEIIQKILFKLQVLLADSQIVLEECIVEMGYLSQARDEYIQQLIKKEVANMPITRDIKKSLWYDDVRRESLEDGKQEGKLEDAKRMIELGLSLDLVQQCTGLSLKLLKSLQRRMKS
jgi:predicted transposase/invertase (TIGR01784 family)